MSLLTDLDAFFTEHRHCGDLDAGVIDVDMVCAVAQARCRVAG